MELGRIAVLARQDAGRKFHSIAHLLTKEALWEAFDNLRKDAAAGVDGVTYAEYEEHLVENLVKLHEKLKGKSYRAQPRNRCAGSISTRRTGERGRSRSPALKTRSYSGPRWSYSTQSSSKTFSTAPTDSGRDEVHTTRWTKSAG